MNTPPATRSAGRKTASRARPRSSRSCRNTPGNTPEGQRRRYEHCPSSRVDKDVGYCPLGQTSPHSFSINAIHAITVWSCRFARLVVDRSRRRGFDAATKRRPIADASLGHLNDPRAFFTAQTPPVSGQTRPHPTGPNAGAAPAVPQPSAANPRPRHGRYGNPNAAAPRAIRSRCWSIRTGPCPWLIPHGFKYGYAVWGSLAKRAFQSAS